MRKSRSGADPSQKRDPDSPLIRWIREHAAGQDVLELGYAGPATLRRLRVASDSSARQVRCAMSWRPAGLSAGMLGGAGELAVWTDAHCDLPRAEPDLGWFAVANIFHLDAKSRIGEHDLVILGGDQLGLSFEPELIVQRALNVCREHLIIVTRTLGEPVLRDAAFEPCADQGGWIYAANLTDKQSALLNAAFRTAKMPLDQFERFPTGFTRQQAREVHPYFWFATEAAIRLLLERMGLVIVKAVRAGAREGTAFICRRRDCPAPALLVSPPSL